MITLALDASTHRGSVAVLDDARVLVQSTAAMRGQDREQLMPAVATALREAGAGFHVVERVVCGAGPGSFTSLRIAASIAKGIAVGRAIPLFAISSLALIVFSMRFVERALWQSSSIMKAASGRSLPSG